MVFFRDSHDGLISERGTTRNLAILLFFHVLTFSVQKVGRSPGINLGNVMNANAVKDLHYSYLYIFAKLHQP